MTTPTNEPTAPMQSNISIDLKSKNNSSRPYYKPTGASRASAPRASVSRPTNASPTRASSYARNAGNRGGARITSEIFLKHREEQASQSIADLKKLIKKDEIPVRVFAL